MCQPLGRNLPKHREVFHLSFPPFLLPFLSFSKCQLDARPTNLQKNIPSKTREII